MPPNRTLADVATDVDHWIAQSSAKFAHDYIDANGQCWVLKFFAPQHLAGFMRDPRLFISTTPGFTWGDGVYVVPLAHVYSAMIYGRVGVMGWIAASDLGKIYDAANPIGLSLYQEWIQFKPGLFRLLTTTVHAQAANRKLRNAFRRRFGLDLVIFQPDEFNRAYVKPTQDRWCVVADFSTAAALPAGAPGFSPKVRECQLVAIGTEEFIVDHGGFVRQDLIGSAVVPAAVRRPRPTTRLVSELTNQYKANAARGAKPPTFYTPEV